MSEIAIAVIALLALIVSIYEMRSSREYRRLSVTPHISFLRESSFKENTFRIIMESNGIGPARITHHSLSLNGRHQDISNFEDFQNYLKAAGIDGCEINYYARMTPGDFHEPGKKLRIIDLSEIKLYEGKEDLFDKCFENINVHVKYESIYGDKHESSAWIDNPPKKAF